MYKLPVSFMIISDGYRSFIPKKKLHLLNNGLLYFKAPLEL